MRAGGHAPARLQLSVLQGSSVQPGGIDLIVRRPQCAHGWDGMGWREGRDDQWAVVRLKEKKERKKGNF
jgi:hypothetical protein